jgi:hypothetical protein
LDDRFLTPQAVEERNASFCASECSKDEPWITTGMFFLDIRNAERLKKRWLGIVVRVKWQAGTSKSDA